MPGVARPVGTTAPPPPPASAPGLTRPSPANGATVCRGRRHKALCERRRPVEPSRGHTGGARIEAGRDGVESTAGGGA